MKILKMKALVTLGACMLGVVGCGSDGSGGLSDDVLAAECNTLFRCADDGAEDRAWYGTERNCVEADRGTFDILEDYRTFIDAGTVAFDEAALRRCLREMRATCSATLAHVQACDGIFVGQVADGGGCSDDAECRSGECAGGLQACGMCRARLPTGSACTFLDGCADGPNGERGYCDGVCVLAAVDWPTADSALGHPCDDEQACEAGLYCDDNVCARWRSAGEACNPDADSCTSGALCRPSATDDAVGTCIRVRLEARAGEDCGNLATEYVACDAGRSLYCTDGEDRGVCALYQPTQTAGQDCDRPEECVVGLECRSGRCFGAPLADGLSCVRDAECLSDRCAQDLAPPFARTCQAALVCQ